MRNLSLFLIVLVASIIHLDAFLPSSSKSVHATRTLVSRWRHSDGGSVWLGVTPEESSPKEKPQELRHGDILWKIRPAPETSLWKRIWLRFAANVIRLDGKLKRQELPIALCPKGRHAVLEAHYRPNTNSKKYEKIGRFGFTTERGPSNPPIQETVSEVYGNDIRAMVGIGAIIYMAVDKPYRKRNVGTLALEVISLIHSIQGIDFTVLVVDDNGSGKLIDWYAQHGYSKAPKLQGILGSPDGVHGITMIAPTQANVPEDCFIQWW